MSELVFQRDFDAKPGEPIEIAPGICRVTADNASAYTFTGTNSYLLGTDTLALVDPGPSSVLHRAALIEAIGQRTVSHVLLTHTHMDHCECAVEMAEHFGALLVAQSQHRLARPLRVGEPNPYRKAGNWELLPDILMKSGDTLQIDGMTILGWETPGHCANHLCFEIQDTPYILCGDLIMGWSTTMIAPPDGALADYYRSLELMAGLAGNCYLPGHGGEVNSGKPYIEALRAHREQRHVAIRASVQAGSRTIEDLRVAIYPTLPVNLHEPARATLLGHLEFLETSGEIELQFSTEDGYSISKV